MLVLELPFHIRRGRASEYRWSIIEWVEKKVNNIIFIDEVRKSEGGIASIEREDKRGNSCKYRYFAMSLPNAIAMRV